MQDRREILKAFENNSSAINKRVEEGIEKSRKGELKFEVTDKNGCAVSNATIVAKQLTHEFKYGANIFMLDEFETEEKNKLYREHFKELCNIATLPFYWKDLEPTEGVLRFTKDSSRIYRRPALDLCMEYCEENGIEPKEHCLIYETVAPDWLDKSDVNTMKAKYEKRIREVAERYRDRIPSWEVINETLYFWDNASALYLQPDLIEWSFNLAKKYLPDNELVINDAHCNIWNIFNENRSQYYMLIERALAKGAPIDGIGMQFHMFYPRETEAEDTKLFYDPERIYRVLDRYSDFGKPIQITEITIPAYSQSEEDEAIQAELIRWLYSIWFGHSSMEAILYWNLVDGYAAFAPQGDMTAGENYYHGGLFRFDMTPKPACRTIQDLFNKTWHTDTEAATNETGRASVKGFYGDYEITLFHEGKSYSKQARLSKKSNETVRFVVE